MHDEISDHGSSQLEELAARLTNGYKTIGEMVYEVLHESIVAGVFAPGERLRQEAIATTIGVSRIPVRSALLQLESEGLVDFHPRRGAVVRSLTTEQLREIYELREFLEPYALKKSLQSITPERIRTLEALAKTLDKKPAGADFVDARVQFYRALYNQDENPQLVKIIEDLRGSIGRYLLGWRIAEQSDHSHAALVAAVASGDAKLAKKVLLVHLEQVRHGLEGMVADDKAAAKTPA